MDTNLFESIFQGLKEYLKKSTFSPKVQEDVNKPTFPLVVLEEISNTDASDVDKRFGMDIHSRIVYEVSIFAKTIPSGSRKEIVRDISYHVEKYMGNHLGFKRISYSPVPNHDDTVYRIVMRYEFKANVSRNIIY